MREFKVSTAINTQLLINLRSFTFIKIVSLKNQNTEANKQVLKRR